MALEKLKIVALPPSIIGEITVLFNPEAYSIAKTVSWQPPEGAQTERHLNAPTLTFGGGGSRQLTLELLFDATASRLGQLTGDVRTETDRVVALTRIVRGLDHPPICVIYWGTALPGSDFPFVGVVTSLTQRFTLFNSDGRPIRANLTVILTEYLDPKEDLLQTDPELTTHVVKRGDSLSSIAAEVYRDPTQWRIIAEANQLDDPLQIEVGRRLTIPELP